ncbi:hypothetical protein CDB402_2076 [Corynebacterium diphtheriae INCA 402]|nr:hypothetical protein CDB402_2076 [Corynebacterium diphtheriae INCA 402]AEX70835.1 hypothetical protein CDPW8_2192 [Corynebacterium diphtheriae PW8]
MFIGMGFGWVFVKLLNSEGLGAAVIPWGLLGVSSKKGDADIF